MTTSLEPSLGFLDLVVSRSGLSPPNAAQHVLWRQHVHLRALLLEELLVPLVVPCTLLSAKTHEFKTCCEQTTAVICT